MPTRHRAQQLFLYLAVLVAVWTTPLGILMMAYELLYGGSWDVVSAAFGIGAILTVVIALGQLPREPPPPVPR